MVAIKVYDTANDEGRDVLAKVSNPECCRCSDEPTRLLILSPEESLDEFDRKRQQGMLGDLAEFAISTTGGPGALTTVAVLACVPCWEKLNAAHESEKTSRH